jgi:hypothetical protein
MIIYGRKTWKNSPSSVTHLMIIYGRQGDQPNTAKAAADLPTNFCDRKPGPRSTSQNSNMASLRSPRKSLPNQPTLPL